jgi:hypothetical protein
MTPTQEQSIRKHGETLLSIFPAGEEPDPVKLCKKLRRIESAAHRAAEQYCNGEIDADGWDTASGAARVKAHTLLGPSQAPIVINGDPRGYALKIESEWTAEHAPRLHRDWGGYGILAPEIDRNGN